MSIFNSLPKDIYLVKKPTKKVTLHFIFPPCEFKHEKVVMCLSNAANIADLFTNHAESNILSTCKNKLLISTPKITQREYIDNIK